MYAILQQSGHQYRVSPGDRLVVDRLTAEVGTMVALEPVVLFQNDDGTQVGTPVVDGVRVAAMVVSHRKGAKLRVFKYKAKKHYRRTHGHRTHLTELRIEAVLAAGEALPAAPKPAAAKAEAEAPAKPRARRAKAAVETPEAVAASEAPEAVVEAPEAAAPEAMEAEALETPEATEAPEAAAAEAPKKPARSRAKKTDTADTPAAESGETEA